MRILQIIQMSQLRGAELFACQLSNHLINQGNEVLVITLFEGEANLPFVGKIIHLNRPEGKRMWDLKGWKILNNHVKNFKPHLIQANAADTLKYAVSAKIIGNYKIPIVLRNANKMGDFIDSSWKKLLNKFYLSRVSYVISVSEECEKDFIDTFNYPENKVTTIKIGVEAASISGVPEDLEEIFNSKIIITHIGSFVPEKNHLGLLRSFKLIIRDFPNAQLLLIGTGILMDEVKAEVENKNLSDQIHFLESRNDVLDIINNSNVVVLPSLIEGLPGVLLEAMYCRTPVIAYDVGGISEIVTQETGILVKKNDEKGFAEATIEILKNPDEHKINNAYTMVTENFMNIEIAEKFSHIYKEILISTD